jgi:hypothetical protein
MCHDVHALNRQNMLEFYAASGDFTRRLTSIKANSKFSSPLAGPEDYYSVGLLLGQLFKPPAGRCRRVEEWSRLPRSLMLALALSS